MPKSNPWPFLPLLTVLTLSFYLPKPLPAEQDGLQWVKISKLHPTQFTYGALEVESRRKNLAAEKKEHGKHGLDEFLRERAGSAVIGPDGQLYLSNGHHLARAILENGGDHMYIKIVADLSHLSKDAFWKKMESNHYVYLYDRKGKKRTGEELPDEIEKLKNDPYRSLAWLLRKSGGFLKDTKVFFQEFLWGNFLREKMPDFEGGDRRSWERGVKEAMKDWAFSQKAANLPGFIGTTKTHPEVCRRALEGLSDVLDERFADLSWKKLR